MQPNTYTVVDLKKWKGDHEEWVRNSLALELPSIGFAELELVAKAILMVPCKEDWSLAVTPPKEKIAKNSLSNEVGFYLTMGVAKAREVGDFVELMAGLDPDYPEKLKNGFVEKYSQFQASGLTGDALFEALRSFASGGVPAFKYQAAGLAVLSYLFEKCEVFEP